MMTETRQLHGHQPYAVEIIADTMPEALRALADEVEESGDFFVSVSHEYRFQPTGLLGVDLSQYALVAVLDRSGV